MISSVKTATGTYKQPVTKTALLLSLNYLASFICIILLSARLGQQYVSVSLTFLLIYYTKPKLGNSHHTHELLSFFAGIKIEH